MPHLREVFGRPWLEAKGIIDARVSEQHAVFHQRKGQWSIADAGSTHGTWLNGRRLSPDEQAPFADGSVLRAGRQVFVYCENHVGGHEPDVATDLVSPFGLRRLRAQIEVLDPGYLKNILIEGETGTGKELVARLVAARLGRARPWVGVNVGAVAAELIESEFFGKNKGAFTGATASDGFFLAASGGTLLLDEIGELPPALQTKFLRALQEREVIPVGGTQARKFDALVACATKRDLEADVEEGRFRDDLYYRIKQAYLEVLPLRERKADIPALMRAFIERDHLKIEMDDAKADAIERLLLHPWKGNVRELGNRLGDIAAASPGPLRRQGVDAVLGALDAGNIVKVSTEAEIARVFEKNGGNKSKTARDLGMDRNTLKRRLASIAQDNEIDTLLAGMGRRSRRGDVDEPR